jgi:hypothetical protein
VFSFAREAVSVVANTIGAASDDAARGFEGGQAAAGGAAEPALGVPSAEPSHALPHAAEAAGEVSPVPQPMWGGTVVSSHSAPSASPAAAALPTPLFSGTAVAQHPEAAAAAAELAPATGGASQPLWSGTVTSAPAPTPAAKLPAAEHGLAATAPADAAAGPGRWLFDAAAAGSDAPERESALVSPPPATSRAARAESGGQGAAGTHAAAAQGGGYVDVELTPANHDGARVSQPPSPPSSSAGGGFWASLAQRVDAGVAGAAGGSAGEAQSFQPRGSEGEGEGGHAAGGWPAADLGPEAADEGSGGLAGGFSRFFQIVAPSVSAVARKLASDAQGSGGSSSEEEGARLGADHGHLQPAAAADAGSDRARSVSSHASPTGAAWLGWGEAPLYRNASTATTDGFGLPSPGPSPPALESNASIEFAAAQRAAAAAAAYAPSGAPPGTTAATETEHHHRRHQLLPEQHAPAGEAEQAAPPSSDAPHAAMWFGTVVSDAAAAASGQPTAADRAEHAADSQPYEYAYSVDRAEPHAPLAEPATAEGYSAQAGSHGGWRDAWEGVEASGHAHDAAAPGTVAAAHPEAAAEAEAGWGVEPAAPFSSYAEPAEGPGGSERHGADQSTHGAWPVAPASHEAAAEQPAQPLAQQGGWAGAGVVDGHSWAASEGASDGWGGADIDLGHGHEPPQPGDADALPAALTAAEAPAADAPPQALAAPPASVASDSGAFARRPQAAAATGGLFAASQADLHTDSPFGAAPPGLLPAAAASPFSASSVAAPPLPYAAVTAGGSAAGAPARASKGSRHAPRYVTAANMFGGAASSEAHGLHSAPPAPAPSMFGAPPPAAAAAAPAHAAGLHAPPPAAAWQPSAAVSAPPHEQPATAGVHNPGHAEAVDGLAAGHQQGGWGWGWGDAHPADEAAASAAPHPGPTHLAPPASGPADATSFFRGAAAVSASVPPEPQPYSGQPAVAADVFRRRSGSGSAPRFASPNTAKTWWG